jgi:hypothetical protein
MLSRPSCCIAEKSGKNTNLQQKNTFSFRELSKQGKATQRGSKREAAKVQEILATQTKGSRGLYFAKSLIVGPSSKINVGDCRETARTLPGREWRKKVFPTFYPCFILLRGGIVETGMPKVGFFKWRLAALRTVLSHWFTG